MPAKLAIVRLLLCLVLVLSYRVMGQQGWSISGSIMTFHGDTPDRPILVTLQFRGSTIATTFSDSEGKFSFSELSPNPYHLVVNDDKYLQIDQLVEINPLITSPSFVRLSLVPKGESKAGTTAHSNPNLISSTELKQFPRPAQREFEKGRKSQEEGRTKEAITHYQRAIAAAPDFVAARNGLGTAYLGESQFDLAREQFETVIKTNPGDAAAYFNLGNILLIRQQNEHAVHWIGEGLLRQPDSALGHFLIGSVFMRLGRTEPAEKELRTSLQLDPKMSKAHLALVNLYLQQQRTKDASSELKTFLQTFPNDAFAPKAKEVLQRLESKESGVSAR